MASNASVTRDLLDDPYAPELEWPYLRRAILAYGGIGPSPDWERDRYPADLYRADGCAPDVVAAEITLHAGERPPWASVTDGEQTPSDGAMMAYLERAYAAWRGAQPSQRFTIADERVKASRARGRELRAMAAPAPAPVTLKPGQRSYAALVAELKRKHGDRVDLAGLRPEYVKAYETGERISVTLDGREYRGTVGATRGPRPRFVLLLSLDL